MRTNAALAVGLLASVAAAAPALAATVNPETDKRRGPTQDASTAMRSPEGE